MVKNDKPLNNKSGQHYCMNNKVNEIIYNDLYW